MVKYRVCMYLVVCYNALTRWLMGGWERKAYGQVSKFQLVVVGLCRKTLVAVATVVVAWPRPQIVLVQLEKSVLNQVFRE